MHFAYPAAPGFCLSCAFHCRFMASCLPGLLITHKPTQDEHICICKLSISVPVKSIVLTISKCFAGAAASIALLQTDTALVDGALHDLADSAITDTVEPDLPLLSILLQKGLFERVAGGLQAQLIKCLSADPNPPPMLCVDFECSPALHDTADARSTLLPATISLLTSKGYYAQASALCVFHTQLHPAFASFESGMQYLCPYLIAHQQSLASDSKVLNCNVVESWPVPSTLSELQKSLSILLAASIDRMTSDNYQDNF